MSKPKYYLKAFGRCETTWGIDKAAWEAMRLANKKPFFRKKEDIEVYRFALNCELNQSYSGSWAFHPEAMTQRYFIEEKKEKP